MTEKNHKIVAAAARMFARYGYAKTTMGDIAAEAGVARQTVYNAFPGKEEILRAVVRQSGDDTHAAVMDAWAEAQSVAAKLEIFHQLVPMHWFETIRAAPDWADLMDGVHKGASEELAALDIKWRSALTKMLEVDAPRQAVGSVSNEDIVDFFYSASLHAKHGLTEIAQLHTRLNTIKIATLTLLEH